MNDDVVMCYNSASEGAVCEAGDALLRAVELEARALDAFLLPGPARMTAAAYNQAQARRGRLEEIRRWLVGKRYDLLGAKNRDRFYVQP